jgi:glucose/mannose-6-phosphate isomerase
MVDLDNASVYRRYDKSGMLAHLHEFPDQCHQAWNKVLEFELPREYADISSVVILGMGGSAIGGDITRRLALAESSVPVHVHRDYGLPAFVNANTLVIASSYSGNTEETLSAFEASLGTRARKLVITSGGKLRLMAERKGVPVYVVHYKAPPRAAFPHNFVPLLGVFQNLGLLADKSADLRESIAVLNRLSANCDETAPLASNPAKQLAARLQGRIALIYGAEILTEVAQRWKAQFNENGKSWAFSETFPELNHNAVVGYQFPPRVKERMIVLMLRSPAFHARTLLRYQATSELLATTGISCQYVESEGESALARVLSLVLLGDYASFYLAMLNKVDPTSIDAIDFVKQYLARSAVSGDRD